MGGDAYDELKQVQVKIIGQFQRYWHFVFDEENQICVEQILSGDAALEKYNDQWILQDGVCFVDDCKTNEGSPSNIHFKVSAYLT